MRFCLAHASPDRYDDRYLLPEDAADTARMEHIFNDCLCYHGFCGGTHLPGVFREKLCEPGYRFSTPAELDEPYSLGISDCGKSLVNVGSVGQPLDGDPRACYVLWTHYSDADHVSFRRVEYPLDITAAKLKNRPN